MRKLVTPVRIGREPVVYADDDFGGRLKSESGGFVQRLSKPHGSRAYFALHEIVLQVRVKSPLGVIGEVSRVVCRKHTYLGVGRLVEHRVPDEGVSEADAAVSVEGPATLQGSLHQRRAGLRDRP